MINMSLVALTWIIELIIRGQIDRRRTTERIALGLIEPRRIIERFILDLIALTWTLQPIIAVLIERMRIIERIVLRLRTRAGTLERITPGRGVRLLSTQLRNIRCNPIQPHLRTQLPNMQRLNTRPVRVPARRHLTMSTMRSRLTNTGGVTVLTAGHPRGETNLLS
jgi:hypothetical protein